MKMLFTFIFILLIGCTPGEKGVKYEEMRTKPRIFLKENELHVVTENSKENSALLIYEVQPTIDPSKKTLMLKANQAPGKEFRTEFQFNVEELGVKDISEYQIF